MALNFAANLSMLYPEVPFLDRFDRAAQAGFTHNAVNISIGKIDQNSGE
jgi:hydroxypyruvate isomerase